MYVLQHTRQIGGMISGAGDSGVVGRASVSSSLSNASDLLGDAEGGKHGHHGSYLEGNMKLLATMWVSVIN